MKSLLLIVSLVSFTMYKAANNKMHADSRFPTSFKNRDEGHTAGMLIAAFADSLKIAAAEKQLKNKS